MKRHESMWVGFFHADKLYLSVDLFSVTLCALILHVGLLYLGCAFQLALIAMKINESRHKESLILLQIP